MSAIKVILAREPADRDAHFRVRYEVFGEEERYLAPESFPDARESDEFDGNISTLHFNIIIDEKRNERAPEVIGAGRLVFSDVSLATIKGWRYGLPLERALLLDLSHVAPPPAIGEMGRMCVKKAWGGTKAIPALVREMCMESLRRGVGHWISAANLSTSASDDVPSIVETIKERGFVRGDVMASPRWIAAPPACSRFRFRVPHRLPPVVQLDAKLGARYFEPVIFDPTFNHYAMPLLASVSDVLRNAEALLLRRSKGQVR